MLDKIIIKLNGKKEMLAYYEISKNKNIIQHINYDDIKSIILDGIEQIFIFIDKGISTYVTELDYVSNPFYNVLDYRQLTFEEFIYE